MSRYIDADKVLKELHLNHKDVIYIDKNDTAKRIEKIPTIDFVRCKECRHWIGETEYYEDREYKACWQLCGQYMDSEFWCKYGEREGGRCCT